MYTITAELNVFALDDLKQASKAAPGKTAYFVKNKLAPHIKNLVELRLAPLPVRDYSTPFEFGTDKSQKWYFAQVRQGIIPTIDGHYQRQQGEDSLSAHWGVQVDRRRAAENVVTVSNDAYSDVSAPPGYFGAYVYGPFQVAGHAITGYGANFEDALSEITSTSEAMVYDFWGTVLDTKGETNV
jgi:hypothetical protein